MNSENITDKNYIYFKDNFKEITVKHLNEFVAIYNCEVQGYYDTMDGAIAAMKERGFEIGSFIVQKCTESIDNTFAVYYSTYVNNFIRVGE